MPFKFNLCRYIMEHGGVPRQYAVWVWPNSVAEARPAEDTYLGDNPSARAASAPASPVCRAAAAARGALAAGVGAGAPQGCR